MEGFKLEAVKLEEQSGHWQKFPAGLRLLVVDDDPLCLKVVEQMLRRVGYEVTTCTNATSALALLREKNIEYDLVLSDVYMPDMDGFKLLEVVGLELDLPVIMMSSNGDTSNVLRGVTHGACDYLIKPVRLEELRNLWQHVVRRRRQHNMDVDSDEQSQERDDDMCRKRKAEAVGYDQAQFNGSAAAPAGIAALGSAGALAGLGMGVGIADELGLDNGSNKKARVVWSVEMHQQFVNAVNLLGIDKAVPKKILEIMNVDGLTRENVASHLQKYRLYLKRVSGVHLSGHHRAPKSSPPPPPLPQRGSSGGGPASPPPVPAPVSQPTQQPVSQQAGQAQAGGPDSGAVQGPAGPSPATQQGLVGDGGVGLSSASVAATAAASAFPQMPSGMLGMGGPPHPMAAAMANQMAHHQAAAAAAAAAGLSPLLGAMSSLGVGSLSPVHPLNGMQMPNGMGMPGMQSPLGMMPGLSGQCSQAAMGPLGPMGMPGLGGMNHMGGPLQQMAAANLMHGMASMGQLPAALAMNGLMGGMAGMGMPGAAMFPHPQQHQHNLHHQQQLQATHMGLVQPHLSQPIKSEPSGQPMAAAPGPELHVGQHLPHGAACMGSPQQLLHAPAVHAAGALQPGMDSGAAAHSAGDVAMDLLGGMMDEGGYGTGHSPALLLDPDSDIAAAFSEMYGVVGSGPIDQVAVGSAGMGPGLLSAAMDSNSGADPLGKVVTDDDFFSFLLKN